MASDYGGEHANAVWETFTFLVVDMAEGANWTFLQNQFRARVMSNRRRMAYKNLNDSVRRRALDSFLSSANLLPGLLVTFAIAKSVKCLFNNEGKVDPKAAELEQLHDLSPGVAEKLLRITHLLSLLLSGFSAAGQDVLWVTDEDSIVANSHRHIQLVEVLANISSNCLPYAMGHLRVATAKQDSGDLSIEDLLAIADLAAGGTSAALQLMCGTGRAPLTGFWLPRPATMNFKTRAVLDWFSDNSQSLQRFVVLIDETPGTKHLRATHLRFHGSSDTESRQ